MAGALPTLPTGIGGSSEEAAQNYNNALKSIIDSLEKRNSQVNLFNVAAGFLNPGRTGSFAEGLGNAAASVGADVQRQQEQAPNIAMLKAQLYGQQYELQNQRDAYKMIGNALGMPSDKVATEMASDRPSAEFQTGLQQIDPKVTLAISMKSPKIGAMLSDYSKSVIAQQGQDLEERKFMESMRQNLLGNLFKAQDSQMAINNYNLAVEKGGRETTQLQIEYGKLADVIGEGKAKLITGGIPGASVRPYAQPFDMSVFKDLISGFKNGRAAPPPPAAPAPAPIPAAAVVPAGGAVSPVPSRSVVATGEGGAAPLPVAASAPAPIAQAGIVELAPRLKVSAALINEAAKNPNSEAGRMLPQIKSRPDDFNFVTDDAYWDVAPNGYLVVKHASLEKSAPVPAATPESIAAFKPVVAAAPATAVAPPPPAPVAIAPPPPAPVAIAPPPPAPVAIAPPAALKISAADQAGKDVDAVAILQAEKAKAEARVAAAKQANDQAGLTRAMSDSVSIDREIGRMAKGKTAVAPAPAVVPAPAPAVKPATAAPAAGLTVTAGARFDPSLSIPNFAQLPAATQRALLQDAAKAGLNVGEAAAKANIDLEKGNAAAQNKTWNDKLTALGRFSPQVNSAAINNLQFLRTLANSPDGNAVFGVLQARDFNTVVERAAKAAGQVIEQGVGIGHFGHVNVPVDDIVRNLNLNDNQKVLASRALNAIAEETVANLSLNREAIGGRLSNYEDKQLSAAITNMNNIPEAIYYWAGKRLVQHGNDAQINNLWSSWDKAHPNESVKNPGAFFRDEKSGYEEQNKKYFQALTGLDKLLLKRQ